MTRDKTARAGVELLQAAELAGLHMLRVEMEALMAVMPGVWPPATKPSEAANAESVFDNMPV